MSKCRRYKIYFFEYLVFDADAVQKVSDFYDKQMDGMFDQLDTEIYEKEHNNGNNLDHQSESTSTAPILLNYRQKQSVSDDDDSFNDDYKQQRIPYQARKRSNNIQPKKMHFVSPPHRKKVKTKYGRHNNNEVINVSPVSSRISPSSSKRHRYNMHEEQQEHKKIYVNANGHKLSDHSFKMMQEVLNQLENIKYTKNKSDAMQGICHLQTTICNKIKPTQRANYHEEFENNSDEKMSTDDHISIQSPQMYYKQAPPSPNKRHQKYRPTKNKPTPRSKRKSSYNHTHYHQMNVSKMSGGDNSINNFSFSNNNNSVTNINIAPNDRRHSNGTNVRRKLSFHSEPNADSEVSRYDDWSSPEIIQKQQKKLARTYQEIHDLQNELRCVYDALNAARKNREKLAADKECMRKEYKEQINTIHRQLDQLRLQTALYHKEQREIEADIQRQNNHESSQMHINVSPAKSQKKSNRQRQEHHHYRR